VKEKRSKYIILLFVVVFIWQIIGISLISIHTLSKTTNYQVENQSFSDKETNHSEIYSLEFANMVAEETDELFELELDKPYSDENSWNFSKCTCFILACRFYKNIFIDLPDSPPELTVKQNQC
jgi:hypothetical protein